MSTTETGTYRALSGYTTLRLGGPAHRFVTVGTDSDLIDAVRAGDGAGEPLLLLGGGSNLVVADQGFDGTAVRIATSGLEYTRETGADTVYLDAAAGQDWDGVVADTVAAGLGGLECLSGIPGMVGATPIQNVGAYGCEISELLVSARVYDRTTGSVDLLGPDDLDFAYRTSALKGTDRGVVLGVRFALHRDGLSRPVRYGELARTLGVEVGARVPAARAREAVLELRRGKGMVLDPGDHDTWSAGSFFTNPVVPESLAEAVGAIAGAERMPRYPASGGVKLSAAWLIERAGFGKGHPGAGGRVRLSTKHTLALTNRGAASTAELLELAREVREGVRERFGVTLHPEPLLINCSL